MVTLVLMVPLDFIFLLVLVVPHEFFCSLDPTAPFNLIFPLVLLVPHDLVALLVRLDLAVPLVLVVFHNVAVP